MTQEGFFCADFFSGTNTTASLTIPIQYYDNLLGCKTPVSCAQTNLTALCNSVTLILALDTASFLQVFGSRIKCVLHDFVK